MQNQETSQQVIKSESRWKPWGDHPVIVTILVLTAIIGVSFPLFQIFKNDHEVEYVGRVIDSRTQAPIRSAKVTLDIKGAPPVVYTDSEGIYLFPLVLSDTRVTGHVRVDAEGYIGYDRNISLSSKNTQLEDIRLNSAIPTSLPTTPITSPPTPIPVGQWNMEYFTNPKLDAPVQGSLSFSAEENSEGGYALLYRSEERRAIQPIPANNWSTRFVGRFPFEDGRYIFHCGHNDGCRVFVDSKNIIDAWWDGDGGNDQEIDLSSGIHTVRIEFYDKSGFGYLDLWWKKLNPAITPSPTTLLTTTTAISTLSATTVSPPTTIIPTVTSTSSPISSLSQIAFTSNRNGNQEVYLMNSDGTFPHRLTDNHPGLDYSPSWSPDGKSLVFVSTRDGDDEIYVIQSDGTGLRQLTSDKALDQSPAWSPDGKSIAFVSDRDGNNEIYIMNTDGTNIRRITNNPGLDLSPTWSPDSQFIAFDSEYDGNREIFIVKADEASDLRQLTTDPKEDITPAWSPDGKSIAFTSNREGNYDIYVIGFDGSNLRNLTEDRATDSVPSWSPDSKSIAFQSNRNKNNEIYVLDLNGTKPVNLTRDNAADSLPAWSMK